MADDELAAVTADRDRWRELARKHERDLRVAQRRLGYLEPVAARHEALMEDLAGHMVSALKEAKYVQVNPAGVPTRGSRKA